MVAATYPSLADVPAPDREPAVAFDDLVARARWFGGWLSVLADELAKVKDDRDHLRAELAKRNAWIESDRKCAEELHARCGEVERERDDLRRWIAAAEQRCAELEDKVKRVTGTGADLLLDRNALASRVIGWASALCGDRERTIDQALADIGAELPRLAEQRDATSQILATVTRERDELRRQLAPSRAPAATPATGTAELSGPIIQLLNKLLAVDFAAAERFLGLDDVFLSKLGDLVLRGRGMEERALFDPELLVHEQIAELAARLRARQPTAAELALVPGFGDAEVLS